MKLGLNLEKFSEREDYDYHGREVGWAIQKMLGRVFHVSKLILHMSRNWWFEMILDEFIFGVRDDFFTHLFENLSFFSCWFILFCPKYATAVSKFHSWMFSGTIIAAISEFHRQLWQQKHLHLREVLTMWAIFDFLLSCGILYVYMYTVHQHQTLLFSI